MNALLIGYLMHRSGLMPRVIPRHGLAGAPLLLGAVVAVMFDVFDRTSVWAVIALAPIFVCGRPSRASGPNAA